MLVGAENRYRDSLFVFISIFYSVVIFSFLMFTFWCRHALSDELHCGGRCRISAIVFF